MLHEPEGGAVGGDNKSGTHQEAHIMPLDQEATVTLCQRNDLGLSGAPVSACQDKARRGTAIIVCVCVGVC